ncbi:MAG: FHA domain-containing protein [Clostridia bacterium]|nr:FHA domain-containing protein [Clostridia bacterium]
MKFDTTETILLLIMILFGIVAVYVTKRKPEAKKPETKVEAKTVKIAEGWTVFNMDKEGNCVNSASIPQTEDSFIIGTSPDSDFRILNKLVSRRHLIVVNTDNGMMISDNNSSYSTFINGNRIIDSPVENGQVVWLADSPVIFIAPGTYTDEKKLKALTIQNIRDYGVPVITEK